MTDQPPDKSALRRKIGQLRRQQQDREQATRTIQQRLTALPAWQVARSILFYISVKSEVGTQELLTETLLTEKQVIVPWCHGDLLELVHLKSTKELTEGSFHIPEPSPLLRTDAARQVGPENIDLALIPGVAFDARGNRLGQGRGYYDRLIPLLRPDCLRIGLAFNCQIVETVPTEPHDQPMHIVVTTDQVIDCR